MVETGSVTAILGEQRGDEGKGRFSDMLAAEHDIVARFNGGSNAGHTIVLEDGTEHKLHLLPSGITNPHTMNVIGNGVVVDAVHLVGEIETAAKKGIELDEGRLMISSAAHLLLPEHKSRDEIREAGKDAQGSTKSGISPAYSDKAFRSGVRVEIINNDIDGLHRKIVEGVEKTNEDRERVNKDKERQGKELVLLDPLKEADAYVAAALQLGRFSTDTTLYLNRRLKAGDRVLAEGAQAFLLDLDHGMYDAVTSSSTTVGGILTGLGIPAKYLERIVGVAKAVPSHVGGGPFATEIHDDELLERLHGDPNAGDAERGTKTGRWRRLGFFDLAALRRAQMVNGSTELALTKLDWVPRYGDTIPVCTGYERKGKQLEVSPDAAYKLRQSSPILTELPNWTEDVSGVRKFRDLPKEAQGYINFLEDQTEVPITMIGVGQRRDQVIIRK